MKTQSVLNPNVCSTIVYVGIYYATLCVCFDDKRYSQIHQHMQAVYLWIAHL